MSAISGYISTIQNAVYGEQVRTAIVNALLACYSDVENPDLQSAAFQTAIENAYEDGILDITTVTSFNDMTNQNIIYRYNGTAAGKQKGLYYYSALSNSWVLIGSEIQKVSLLSQMTDVNDIYKYIGTESGMVQNSLYCHNGTSWVPIGSGLLTASTAAQMTNTEAIYKYTGNETGYVKNGLYYYSGTEWTNFANPNGGFVTFNDIFSSRSAGLVPAAPAPDEGGEDITYTISPLGGTSADYTVSQTSTGIVVALNASGTDNKWRGVLFGSTKANFKANGTYFYIIIGYNQSKMLAYVSSDTPLAQLAGKFAEFTLGNNKWTAVANGPTINANNSDITIETSATTLKINGQTVDISSLMSGYTPQIGFIYALSNYYSGLNYTLYGSSTLDTRDMFLRGDGQWAYPDVENHWKNKKWYAYGTSLTNTSSEGKYPTYLAQLSGMQLTNKGISGGSIMGNIKTAIMNITDGKTEADLITLEIGANDYSATLGTIYDTGSTTFCGCLNQSIRYLQENTDAQIVVMPSTLMRYSPSNPSNPTPPETTYGSDNHTLYDQHKAIEEICKLNGCYHIPFDQLGLGYSRMSNDYLVDQIHHTALGGYNLAQGIWGYLKNIPLWYTQIPS